MNHTNNVPMQAILNIPRALIDLNQSYPGTPLLITNESTMWAIKINFGGSIEHPITHEIIEMLVDPSVARVLPDDMPFLLYVYGDEQKSQLRANIEQMVQYEQSAAGVRLLKRSCAVPDKDLYAEDQTNL